jgi:hypothetical protein
MQFYFAIEVSSINKIEVTDLEINIKIMYCSMRQAVKVLNCYI